VVTSRPAFAARDVKDPRPLWGPFAQSVR